MTAAPSPRCSVLVLGEDAASSGHDTLTALAKRMFLLLDPACQTHHIRFEPPDNEAARQAVRGNLWKSRDPKDRSRRIDLLRYIAGKLASGPRSFVLFHVDADRVWKDRETSENVARLRELIDIELPQVAASGRTRTSRTRGTAPEPPPPALDTRQLLLLIPHYSIEAWLFQNTDRAIDLCRADPHCRGQHVDLLRSWSTDRGALDDLDKPKERLCFRDRHNTTLAGPGFPTDDLWATGKSFTETMTRLLECETLTTALAETHQR